LWSPSAGSRAANADGVNAEAQAGKSLLLHHLFSSGCFSRLYLFRTQAPLNCDVVCDVA
jgi:hypothetical protein